MVLLLNNLKYALSPANRANRRDIAILYLVFRVLLLNTRYSNGATRDNQDIYDEIKLKKTFGPSQPS